MAASKERWKRRWRSRWLIARARLRTALRRPPPPAGAPIAPSAPSSQPEKRPAGSYLTALVTINVVIVALSFLFYWRTPAPPTTWPLPTAASLAPAATETRPAKPTRAVEAIRLTPTIAWPTPDPLSDGGAVAFSLRQNGNSDIYVLGVGQAAPVRLTAHPAEDRDPAWSPDGRRLAWSSRRDGNWDIYLLDLATGRTRRLTHYPGFDGGPAWSPDGQWLVYESYREGNLDLYVVEADGQGEPIRLTSHPAADYSPAWSPGGRHIAFASWRAGNPDIFLVSLDDASDATAINLTNSPESHEDHPAFHPAGAYLAYSSASAGFEIVYALPLEGYRPAGEAISLSQGEHPASSPDGDEIVYAHRREGQTFLVASAMEAWHVAPQLFATTGELGHPSWTAATLPGDLSLSEVNRAEDSPLFVEDLAQAPEGGPPVLLRQLPVEAPAPYLSDRVEQSFHALRQRTIEETGWDFLGQLDAMFEPLEQLPLPGQSERNWNKAGRAFDVDYDQALAFEPLSEVVPEVEGNQTTWRIYLRASLQDGSQGEPLRVLPWDFRARYGADPEYYDQGGKFKESVPAGYYVDFTRLAADYGWLRIPSDSTWRTYFPGVRFWHYENRQGLSWQEAMLEIYPQSALSQRFGE